MRTDKKSSQRNDKKAASRGRNQGVVGYSKKSALLEEAITQMNAGKYGRSSAALKELLALEPLNMEARRLFATLHLRLGSLIPARHAFESLVNEAFERQDYWLAESLLREYLAAGPRCVPFLEKLGTIYQDKGDALAAVTEYGKAIDILVEDPDPDRPALASELYAKVRELAPASPVAIRLASFFDAQSGELIVSGKQVHPDPLASATGNPQSSAEPALSSGTEDTLSHLVDPPRDPAHLREALQSLAESTAPPDSAQEPSADPTAALEESQYQEGGNTAGSGQVLEESAPEPAHELTQAEPPGQPSTQDCAEAAATISFVEFSQTGSHRAVAQAETSSPDLTLSQSPDRGSEDKQPSGADSLSDPMPWERVEDSSITIPAVSERDTDAPMRLDSTTESAHAVPASPPLESRQDAAGPTAESPSPEAAPEPHTKENLSWESVIARLREIAGAPSSLDQKVDTPNVEIPPVNGPAGMDAPEVPAAIADAPPNQPDVTLRDNAVSSPAFAPEPVVAPMPWDQVQDATIKIEVPKDFEPPALHPVDEGIGPTTAIVTAAPEPPAFSYVASSPSPTAEEPDSPVSIPASSDVDSAVAPAEVESAAQPLVLETAMVSPVEPAAIVETLSEPAADTSLPTAVPPEAVPVPPVEQAIAAPEPAETSLPPSLAPEPISFVTSPGEESAPPAAIHETSPAFSEEPLRLEQPVHWKTGEVAVQTHRPTPKKRKKSSPPVEESAGSAPAVDVPMPAEPEPPSDPVVAEPSVQSPEPAREREGWVGAVESIRFVETPTSTGERVAVHLPAREESQPVQPVPAAVSAVDVLFDTTRNVGALDRRDRSVSKRKFSMGTVFSRIRIGIISFLASCFSTTRAIVTTLATLAVLLTVLLVLGIGAVGMAWLVMEEKPTPAYQALTTLPQRAISDARKNGYLLLLGFDSAPSLDPIQAGYERKSDGKDAELTSGCTGRNQNPAPADNRTPAGTVSQWFGTPDPAAHFRRNQDQVKGWAGQSAPALGRYKEWLTMRFDDWGYGQSVSPPCSAILATHRLYVAEGFAQAQGLESAVDRLEGDMEVWRMVLSQAKTLPVKMMALQAINDDIAVASGLLVRQEAEGGAPDRLAKMLRPFDQMELSLRWPIQSHLVAATKAIDGQLKADRFAATPWYVRVAAMLPLPKQRRFNDYAKYYEASYKAAGEGRFGSMPKRSTYVGSRAFGVTEVLRNPIEMLVGLEPLAEWEFHSGLVVETDARLRLASLQVWLRRGPQGADLMAQIAKAGQSFYDPFTGLPMLVNLTKGVMYSVGHDGKDQDGHPQADVVALIPPGVTLNARIAPGGSGPK